MSFPYFDVNKRTDISFRARNDPEHHKEYSPLERLPIDMINDIPVADSLHLIDFGIMKRCLKTWIHGSSTFENKFTKLDRAKINEHLNICNGFLPCEMHRGVRSLDDINFWKALEFRNFMLYFGFIILKEVLEPEVYNHFLLLFGAIRIISCQNYLNKFINIADKFIQIYLERYIDIYGSTYVSSNVHNLTHIIDDVKRFGPLPTISAYPFENALHEIKLLLRNGNQPLSQVARRISELNAFNMLGSTYKEPDYSKNKNKIVIKDGFTLSNDDKNKYFLTINNEIVAMQEIDHGDNEIQIIGESYSSTTNFFEIPYQSSNLDIFLCDNERNASMAYSLNNIKCKMIHIPYKNQNVFIPLLHTLKIN